MYGVDDASILKLKAAVKVVDGVAVGVEGRGGILVPFEQKLPIVGVVLPKMPQLVDALIMAEPTSVAVSCIVGRG